MQYIWLFDPAHLRMVQYEIGPQGMRVVAVHAAPGADLSDLPAGIAVTPLADDVLPHLQAAARGDPTGLAAVTDIQRTLNADTAARGGQVWAPATGTNPQNGGLRDLPEDINAQTHIANTLLTGQVSDDALAQQEQKLRTEMGQYGVNPADLFGMYQQRRPQPGGEVSQDASGLRLPAAQVNAYTDRNAAALNWDRLARTEYLQQVSNAWEARKTGADRLQKYGDSLRAARSGQASLDQQELMLSRDPAQDRNLMVVPNDPTQPGNLYATPGGTTIHRQNAGGVAQVQKDQNDASQMRQQWWPDQYQAQLKERQRAIVKGGGRIDPSWGIDAQGNDIPAYAGGGEYGYLPSAPGGQNLGDPYGGHGTSENSGSDPNQVQAVADYTRQQGFANQLEQSDLSAQLARIQQQAQFQMQQMGQQHQLRMGALQQELSIAQGEAERARAGLAQQRGWAQGQYDLQPLAQQGGQQWAG